MKKNTIGGISKRDHPPWMELYGGKKCIQGCLYDVWCGFFVKVTKLSYVNAAVSRYCLKVFLVDAFKEALEIELFRV